MVNITTFEKKVSIPPKRPKYPYLGVSTRTGSIVFFTAPDTGIRVKGSPKDIDLTTEAGWMEKMAFEPYRGVITLTLSNVE